MHSDHRQPGWNVYRPTCPPAMFNSSTFVLSGVRVSSGELKSRCSSVAIVVPPGWLPSHTVATGTRPLRPSITASAGLTVHALEDGGLVASSPTFTPPRRSPDRIPHRRCAVMAEHAV